MGIRTNVAALAGAVAVGMAGGALLAARQINGPQRPAMNYGLTPFEVGAEAESVTFTASDGIRLAGWWFDRDQSHGTQKGAATQQPPRHARRSRMSRATSPGTYVKYAWLSLLGYILSFAISFAVGEGLASALGRRYGNDAESGYPTWVIAVSAGVALFVFAIPGFVAWFFGRRAWRAGDARGRIPAWLGLGLAFGFVAMNVAALIMPNL